MLVLSCGRYSEPTAFNRVNFFFFFPRILPNLRQTALLSKQGRLKVLVACFIGKLSVHQHLPRSSDLTAALTPCEREVPEDLPGFAGAEAARGASQ